MGIATLSEAEQAINAGVYPGPTATVVDEVADRVARISGAVKKMADDALYAAKNAGKNTVTLASVLRDGVAASIVFKKP
jgi:GGDEF domain-containing protein